MKKSDDKPVSLVKDELVLLQQVLYSSRWNGQEWEQTIKLLINKLAKMTEQL